jgi:hypothetical protein
MNQQVNIGRYSVSLKELTWWETEEVKSILATGAKMNSLGVSGFNGSALLDAKIQTFKFAITEIKEGDVVIPFSIEWVKGLTHAEGIAIEAAMDELGKKK